MSVRAVPALAIIAVLAAPAAAGPPPPPPPPPAPPLPAFRFAEVYSDHMVLQRAPSTASVWGFAPAGASVSLKAGAAAASATASAAGVWRASLPAQPASSTPVALTATSGGKTISVKDVLFGDVRLPPCCLCRPGLPPCRPCRIRQDLTRTATRAPAGVGLLRPVQHGLRHGRAD